MFKIFHCTCMKIGISAQYGLQFRPRPLVRVRWDVVRIRQIFHHDYMKARCLVRGEKIDLGLGNRQAGMKGLIETQFALRFESGSWTLGINRFDNDCLAWRMTLSFRGQGHSIHAAPSERELLSILHGSPG